MSLYSNFKLNNSRAMSMYVAAPIDEFKATQKELQERYRAAATQDDKLATELSKLQVADFDNDRQMKDQLVKHFTDRLNSRLQRGDYETMGRETVRDGIAFVKEYAPLKQNLDKYTAWQTELKERLKKGEITKDRYDFAVMSSKYNYKGLDPENLEGSMFNGYQPLKHVDIGEAMMKAANDWKANSSESPYHFDGKMFWTKDKTRKVDYNEVKDSLRKYISNNPEYMAYIDESVKINTFGRQYTEDMVAPLRAKYVAAAKTDKEKKAYQSLPPAQFAAMLQRESIIEDYINPAAEKAAFTEYSSESMMDPEIRAMKAAAGKSRAREIEEQRMMMTLDSEYSLNTQLDGMDMFKGVEFGSDGKLVDYGGTDKDPELKSRQWEAKIKLNNFKTQFMEGATEKMTKYPAGSKEHRDAKQTYNRFKNMSDSEWAQHVNKQIENRRLSNTYELKFTNPKVLNYYQKSIIGQRDFSGRALKVAGLDGVTTIDQLVEELGIEAKDQKAFYDSMRINGINMMAGSDEANQALAGGFKMSFVDPNTGKRYSGIIQNNNEVAQSAAPFARGSMFAMTNTSIGYPVPKNAKHLTPAQIEDMVQDHVLPDPLGQPGHRAIGYNTVNAQGELVPVFRRQIYHAKDGKWVDVPNAKDFERYRRGEKVDVGLDELTYEDYRRISKERLETLLGRDAHYKSSVNYEDDYEEDSE